MNEPLTPEPIIQAMMAFQVSAALRAAIELDLFAAVKIHGTLAEIAGHIKAPERTTRMLCDALVSVRFLAKKHGKYALAPLSDAFLDPAKPGYFGGMAHIATAPMVWDEFGRLAQVVRHGGTLRDDHALKPRHEFWETFAKHSGALAGVQGRFIAGELQRRGVKAPRVLDLAAGTGLYGFSIAAADPGAKVTTVDWPNVLEHSRGYARAMKVERRVTFLPGDIFKADLGKDHDVVLLTNIYHHFNRAQCVELSKRARATLKPGGIAVVVEFIPDDERAQAAGPLLFSLIMMAWTPQGDTYTAAQYREILKESGFKDVEFPQAPIAQQLIFAK